MHDSSSGAIVQSINLIEPFKKAWYVGAEILTLVYLWLIHCDDTLVHIQSTTHPDIRGFTWC
jgi:hypothetical protein